MSDLFAFDTPATVPLLDAAKANSVDSLSDLQARPWQGVGLGIGTGFMRGGARVAQAAGMAGFGLLQALNSDPEYTIATGKTAEPLPEEVNDHYFRALDEHVNDAVDYWTPNPHEVGKAGQILGGLSEVALPLAAGGGNPALLIGTQELGQATDLSRGGVDAATSLGAGVISGVATAAGLKVPIVGKTLTSRLASGAAGNVVFGASSREAEKALLTARGYEDQAPKVLDLASISADALTGLLFGGLHHAFAPVDPKLTPSQVDAVLTARNAKNFITSTTPGTPEGVSSEVAHQSALTEALNQLSKSQAVDVSQVVAEHPASFTPDGRLEESVRTASEVAQAQPTDVPYEGTSLTDRFEHQLTQDPAAAVEQYAQLKDSEGGKVLNTDTARELSPEYRADRSLSADVHEPASAFIKRLYAQKLAEPPKAGEEPLVVFSAGGTGAGKSVGLSDEVKQTAQIIYDTNLNRLASARQKIDQALAADKKVVILYTYRDPIEALRQGALTRSMRQERNLGSGRTVPLNEHVGTHIGAREVVPQLAAHYAGDPRVEIRVIDNSQGKGNARPVPLSSIPSFDPEAYTRLREEASRTLDAERAAGRISDAVYRGFNQDSARTDGGPLGTVDGEAPEPAHEGVTLPVSGLSLEEALQAKPEALSAIPEVAALQSLVNERPNTPLYTGADADGIPLRTTLADEAEAIQREYDQSLKDAKAYSVAVQCFLGHGA